MEAVELVEVEKPVGAEKPEKAEKPVTAWRLTTAGNIEGKAFLRLVRQFRLAGHNMRKQKERR